MIIQLIVRARPIAKYLLIGWLIIIVFVSSIPSLPTLKIEAGKHEIRLDYVIHFCEYGLLAFLAFLSFTGEDFKMSYRKFLLIVSCLILFAILDEFHQKLIPGRSFNPNDIASNILGILVIMIFCILLFKKTANYLL